MMGQHLFTQWLGGVTQQAITQAKVGPDLCGDMPSLGHNEFNKISSVCVNETLM